MGQLCSVLRIKPSKEPCDASLTCGHPCKRSKYHAGRCNCQVRCEHISPCGHQCKKLCGKDHIHLKHCQRRCMRTCLSGKRCKLPCWAPCEPCSGKCPMSCMHGRCGKECGDWVNCEMPLGCLLPCQKSCLQCGSSCIGLCGHTCPPCPSCAPFVCPISLEEFNSTTKGPIAYKLSDCKCSFQIDALDTYMKLQVEKAMVSRELRIKCPRCTVPITRSWRYAEEIRRCLYQTTRPTDSINVDRLSRAEFQSIYSAMNKTENAHVQRNHWYQCPNGHPFFVDYCGTPVEGGWCNECRVPIGADHGRIISRPWRSSEASKWLNKT